MIWGNPNIQWHKDIVDEASNIGYKILEVLGGGWLLLKPEEKTVYVWSKSERFGIAPISFVQEIFKEKVIEKEPE